MKSNLINEQSGQARIILIMIVVPIALVLFLVMLNMVSPVLDSLFPQIDNMAASGYIAQAGILKTFVALIPTIIILLYIYSIITEVIQK